MANNTLKKKLPWPYSVSHIDIKHVEEIQGCCIFDVFLVY